MSEQDSRLRLRVGAFVLAALLLFAGSVLALSSRSRWFEGRSMLRTSFRSVDGLLVGAPVRLAGVTVGQVAGIGFAPDPGDKRIAVELSVDHRYRDKIREDSVATIGTIGLVGDKDIEITVGNHDRGVLGPGAAIPSLDPPDYGQIMQHSEQIVASVGKLAAALTQGSGLAHDLVYDPKGGQILRDLAQSAANLKQVTGKLARGEGTLGALLEDATLYEDLSTLLRGAERSWILRTVIRSSQQQGKSMKAKEGPRAGLP